MYELKLLIKALWALFTLPFLLITTAMQEFSVSLSARDMAVVIVGWIKDFVSEEPPATKPTPSKKG